MKERQNIIDNYIVEGNELDETNNIQSPYNDQSSKSTKDQLNFSFEKQSKDQMVKAEQSSITFKDCQGNLLNDEILLCNNPKSDQSSPSSPNPIEIKPVQELQANPYVIENTASQQMLSQQQLFFLSQQ